MESADRSLNSLFIMFYIVTCYLCFLYLQLSAETLNQHLGNPKCGYLHLLHSINNLEISNDFGLQVEQLLLENADLLGK